MTRREFFQAVANNEITEEVIAYAVDAIEKLDVPTKTQIENAELVQKMVEMFAGQSNILAHDIAEKMDITTSKVTALCRMAVKDGKVTVDEGIINKSVKKIYSFK